jgi:putative transposase
VTTELPSQSSRVSESGIRFETGWHQPALGADITYIRLAVQFVYLAVILDAFSRRVIGWALERTLEDKLTVAALEMALERRRPGPGLVHHSDCGVQYVSLDYTGVLKQHGITISMSRSGNPYATPSANRS